MSKEHPIDSAAHSPAPEQSHERSLSPSREDQARAEIGHTEITPAQARFVSVVFLALLCWVPFTQHRIGFRQYQRTGEPPESLQFYRAFAGIGSKMATAWREGETPLTRWLDANTVLLKQIHVFEETLDDVAWVTQRTQAPVQALMCRLGVGNEKAFIGREGWLFYEPGVRSLTGPGFLEPRQLARRRKSGDETTGFTQPDPVKGITHFRDQLSLWGIELFIVPVPVKPTIYPEKFSSRYEASDAPIHNASYAEWVRQLADAGVQVIDPTEALLEQKAHLGRYGLNAYLKTDTHWTSRAMAAVAIHVENQLKRAVELSAPITYVDIVATTAVTNSGDIATMLKLPEGQTLFLPETVRHSQRVARPSDHPREVLILGDSFANIYSQEAMNWGRSGGFAEAVSMSLQRPVDAIIRNDAGAYATRLELAKQLRQGRDVLAGKKAVVWVFAARELALGDWRLIELVRPEAAATNTPNVAMSGGVATGTVAATSDRPRKGAVYKDFIFKLHVTGLKDASGQVMGDGEGVVFVFGMRDRVIQKITSVNPGDPVTFRLRPWDDVKSKYGSMKAGELADFMIEVEKPLYWGEAVK